MKGVGVEGVGVEGRGCWVEGVHVHVHVCL